MKDDQITQIRNDITAINEKLQELELRIIANEECNDRREDGNFELFDVVIGRVNTLFDWIIPTLRKVFPEQTGFEDEIESVERDFARILANRRAPKH